MLDNKKIEESSKVMQQLIKSGKIIKPGPKTKDFFLSKGRKSLIVAKRLLELQEEENIDANLWVINASYYSMFFDATALLAHYNHKIKSNVGIHKITYHALVYYFVKLDNKLKKEIVEGYDEAIRDAEELLQLGENRIKDLITSFDNEMSKRKDFTYEIELDIEKNKAITSFKRAQKFHEEISKVIVK